MALDLSRFTKAFFEEAEEHTSALESLLIGANLRTPDSQTLHAIFRAVHSVKGGAAAFGYTALADFTHDFESILDRVRNGELTLTKSRVNVFLKSGDIMRRHLQALEQESPPDLVALAGVRQELLKLSAQAGDEQFAEVGETIFPKGYRVEMRLERKQYYNDQALDALRKDIAGLGHVAGVCTEAIDATYMTFAFDLDVDTAADELRESLEFLVPAEALSIVANNLPGSVQPPDQLPIDEPDGAFGFFVTPGSAPARATKPVVNLAESDVKLATLSDASSIRVDLPKVDKLINLVGELVIAEAMLSQSVLGMDAQNQTRLSGGLAQLARNTRELQDAVLAIRMLPISFVFSRLPRLTRDLAERLGKEVDLELIGENTELDKSVIEKIVDPLTHLIRNAIDHGIETPDVRIANGKPAKGKLTVRAAHQGGNIVITVSDDGAGLDRKRIAAKACELGIKGADSLDDKEISRLIFSPGFSTATSVTDVSGRGVGMDVVWQNVRALGGKIEIDSAPGVGTSIAIRLPLTLAIVDGMSIFVSGETYILPLASIAQSFKLEATDIKTVKGRELVLVRGEYVPVISLARLFNLPAPADHHEGILVILEDDKKRAALRVDELLGQHQVVLKSLEANYRKVDGVSGATILGDGCVAFILDAAHLLNISHSSATKAISRHDIARH